MSTVPSLRNIAATGPNMNDGRFQRLEEAEAHYNEQIRVSATLNPFILEADNASENPTASQGLNLPAHEVEAIPAFLQTLTDETFLTDPKFSSPFDEGYTQ